MEKNVASYDLHIHSCWSYDARNLPELYFKKAQELGMKAFAITDHHNFDVIPSLFEIAEKFPETVVADVRNKFLQTEKHSCMS